VVARGRAALSSTFWSARWWFVAEPDLAAVTSWTATEDRWCSRAGARPWPQTRSPTVTRWGASVTWGVGGDTVFRLGFNFIISESQKTVSVALL
jgi:hypothetical protein